MALDFLIQLLVNGFIIGLLYGVVAMAFVLIYKSSLVVNFAQGEFLLIGAWACWWLLAQFSLPFYIAFIFTLIFMTIFGVLIQLIILRPLIGEPIISIIMVTIGLAIFFQALMNWMFGVFVEPFPKIFENESINLFGLRVQTVYIMSGLISLLIMISFAIFFKKSRLGLAMRATAFDQQAAQSLGVSVKQVFSAAWGISAMVSAVAGIVFGIVNGISSGIAFMGIKVFPAVILGGLDSVLGAILGGLVIGLLEHIAHYLDVQYLKIGNMIRIAPFYALLIILMIKPYGFFGTKDIERV
ncbi:MAG: branched-chain amino acid ABC transporter permease [Pelagibacterales bacterium]|nr:branched-chain amino acid ABC transporter permease [Pelagibacterales bacterium]|tara:strand:+ start:6496 stop:7389 length:894 start_codon:yes stop_codon:yes gene_type:complete